jgi:cytochrome c-type biogenesis protein CcmF
MVVDEGAIKLVLEGAQTKPEDWLVVQAYEKPFISLLWLGTILIAVGFTVSSVRRAREDQR